MSRDIIYNISIKSHRKRAKALSKRSQEALDGLKDKTTAYANEINKLGKLHEKVYQIYLNAPDYLEAP